MPRKNKKGHGGENNKYDEIKNRSEITGPDGSQYVSFNLRANESIITIPGALITMNNRINKSEIKFDGFFSGVKKLLAGESFVQQKYTGNSNNGLLLLGSNFINSIIVIKIVSGQNYRLSRYSFLASTDNIKLDFTMKKRGIIGFGQDEGLFLPIAKCVSGDYGYIWISAYGSFKELNIASGEFIIVDNGMFLACDNKHNYTLEKIGNSLFSSWLGGEGYGMKFKGPAKIYIQTKNIYEFLMKFANNSNSNSNSNNSRSNNGINISQNLLNMLTS
jgi:uncharacterized protein (AIM24 family)